jgi:glucose-1-phosphate cytidylyltransferase
MVVITLGRQQDWRIAMIDTGIWRNFGERLWAAREQVAVPRHYSDGLSNVNLTEMIKAFSASGRITCFTAVRPSFSMHLVDMQPGSKVERIRAGHDANLWINGGFFILRKEIFDYMREGDELAEAACKRLIEGRLLESDGYT